MVGVVRTVVAVVVLALAVVANPGTAQASDAIRDSQWQLDYLEVAEAHKYSRGEGVIVAVLDSGVDAPHPDLAVNIVDGFDDANGTEGKEDFDGHGTAMAGLIAANGRALGIAPKSGIQSVRTGVGDDGSLQPGLRWAIRNGATVFCIAAAAPGSNSLRELIEEAIAADIVIVAAAGNVDDVQDVAFPAAYPGVVAVAAINKNGTHRKTSVSGPEVILAAPGGEVGTTDTRFDGRSGYDLASGTSPATAIVAGAVALVRSRFPELSAPEVIHRLTATADDKGAKGRDEEYGYGVINIVKALTADVEPLRTAGAPQTTAQAGPSAGGVGGGFVIILAGAVLLFLMVAGAVTWLVARRG